MLQNIKTGEKNMDSSVGSQSIALSELIHRSVDKSYEDLHRLVRTLRSQSETDRHVSILSYLSESRQRFTHLLVLLKWSVHVPLLEQCNALVEQTYSFKNQLNEANDRLFFLHADLNRAKEGVYDLYTSVDVLFNGSYSQLPSCIENVNLPRELPEVDVKETAKELNDLIRFRLLETNLPTQYTHINLEDGFLFCSVKDNFQVVLTLHGKTIDSPWKVVHISTIVDSNSFLPSKDDSSNVASRVMRNLKPTPQHMLHLKNLIQRCINISTQPFHDIFKIMYDFCASLALEVLFIQANELCKRRWKNTVKIEYHRDKKVLDLCYWMNETWSFFNHLFKEEEQDESSQDLPWPKNFLCIRIRIDESGQHLLLVQLNPLPPPSAPISNVKSIESSDFKSLSIERILTQSMQCHSSIGLYYLQQRLTISLSSSNDSKFFDKQDCNSFSSSNISTHARLISGELISIHWKQSCLQMQRIDLNGLTNRLNISVHHKTGKYVIETEPSLRKEFESIIQLQRLLQEHNTYGGSFETTLQKAFSSALRDIAIDQICQIGRNCLGVEAELSIPLSWSKFIEYRSKQGGNIEDLNLTNGAIFFPLALNNKFSYYIVVEIDREGKVSIENSMNLFGKYVPDALIQTPCFSLLQILRRQPSMVVSHVQFFQRLPSMSLDEIMNRNNHSKTNWNKLNNTKKTRLNDNEECFFQHFFLTAVNTCRRKLQLQQICNDARRLQAHVRYSGEGKGSNEEGTGGQLIQLGSEEEIKRWNLNLLEIQSVYAHMRVEGGFEICVKLKEFPFSMLNEQNIQFHKAHKIISEDNILFCYPGSSDYLWHGRPTVEQPLEIFLDDMKYEILPMVRLLKQFFTILKPLKRWGGTIQTNGVFHIEQANIFGCTLICRAKKHKETTNRDEDDYKILRIMIKCTRKGFIITPCYKEYHPLIEFIQSALNIHHNAGQVLEALERTTIPLYHLSCVVNTKLFSLKFNRSIEENDKTCISSGSQKAAGKGMKLGYKGKFGKGMRLGYTSDRITDEKQFTPANLILIPRSQNRLKLAYSNRCGVEICFLQKQAVKVKNAPGGVAVSSCDSDMGQMFTHANFADKVMAICLEMGAL